MPATNLPSQPIPYLRQFVDGLLDGRYDDKRRTQIELAAEIGGGSQGNISKLKSKDSSQMPSLQFVIALARRFNQSFDVLLAPTLKEAERLKARLENLSSGAEPESAGARSITSIPPSRSHRRKT